MINFGRLKLFIDILYLFQEIPNPIAKELTQL